MMFAQSCSLFNLSRRRANKGMISDERKIICTYVTHVTPKHTIGALLYVGNWTFGMILEILKAHESHCNLYGS